MGVVGPTLGGEPPPTIWLRRAVTVPLYLGLASASLATLPLWGSLLFAADVAAGQFGKRPRLRAGAFLSWYAWCEAVGIVAALLLGAVTLGGRLGGEGRYLRANAGLQRHWSDALFRGSLRIFSVRLHVEGDPVPDAPMIVLARHASSMDTVLAAHLIANPHRVLLKYVLKKELRWDPCLDIVGGRLPNVFIDRRRRDASVEAIRGLARDLEAGSAVLIYPEGTRFSRPKLERARERLRREGPAHLLESAAALRWVLPPRIAGPLAVLESAPEADVVFLEHTGLEGAATFAQVWRGDLVARTLRVRLRRVPASDVPIRDRERWLFEQWGEVDRWIEAQRSRAETPTQ